jgi:hypothetical protein
MNARSWLKHERDATRQALSSKMEKLEAHNDLSILMWENLEPIVEAAYEKLQQLIDAAESETPEGMPIHSEALEAHYTEFRDDFNGFDSLEYWIGEESRKIANLILALLKSAQFQVFLWFQHIGYFAFEVARIALTRAYALPPTFPVAPPPLEYRPTIQPNAPAMI